jgi:hypothetical protein
MRTVAQILDGIKSVRDLQESLGLAAKVGVSALRSYSLGGPGSLADLMGHCAEVRR